MGEPKIAWMENERFRNLHIDDQLRVYRGYFDEKAATNDRYQKLDPGTKERVFNEFLSDQGVVRDDSGRSMAPAPQAQPTPVPQQQPIARAIDVPKETPADIRWTNQNIDPNTEYVLPVNPQGATGPLTREMDYAAIEKFEEDRDTPRPSAMDTGLYAGADEKSRGFGKTSATESVTTTPESAPIPKPIDLLKRKSATNKGGPFPTPFGDSSEPIDMPERGKDHLAGAIVKAAIDVPKFVGYIPKTIGELGGISAKRGSESTEIPNRRELKAPSTLSDVFKAEAEKGSKLTDEEYRNVVLESRASRAIDKQKPWDWFKEKGKETTDYYEDLEKQYPSVQAFNEAAAKGELPIITEAIGASGNTVAALLSNMIPVVGPPIAAIGFLGLNKDETYQTIKDGLLRKGVPEAEAEETAQSKGWEIGAFKSVLDMTGIGLLTKAIKPASKLIKKIATSAAAVVWEGGTEGTQGVSDPLALEWETRPEGENLSDFSNRMLEKSDEWWKIFAHDFKIGAIMAGGMTAAGMVAEKALEPTQGPPQAIDPTQTPDQPAQKTGEIDYTDAIAAVDEILASGEGTIAQLEEDLAGDPELIKALGPVIKKYKDAEILKVGRGETPPSRGETPTPPVEPTPTLPAAPVAPDLGLMAMPELRALAEKEGVVEEIKGPKSKQKLIDAIEAKRLEQGTEAEILPEPKATEVVDDKLTPDSILKGISKRVKAEIKMADSDGNVTTEKVNAKAELEDLNNRNEIFNKILDCMAG
jgi:hypothetical protein